MEIPTSSNTTKEMASPIHLQQDYVRGCPAVPSNNASSSTSLMQVVSHVWFEYTMLVLILASSLALCFDDSNVEKGSSKDRALHIMDIIFCVSFGVEVVMKVGACTSRPTT